MQQYQIFKVLSLVGFLITSHFASASTGVSCLIKGTYSTFKNPYYWQYKQEPSSLTEKEKQLAKRGGTLFQVTVVQVYDDTKGRNDFKDCAVRFPRGAKIDWDPKAKALMYDRKLYRNRLNNQGVSPVMWFLYTYGDDRGGAKWELLSSISKVEFKERKNGILR